MTAAAVSARLAILAAALLVPILVAQQGRDLKLFAAQVLAFLGLAAAASAGPVRPLPVLAAPLGAWAVALGFSFLRTESPAGAEEVARQAAFLSLSLAAAMALARTDLKRLFTIWLGTFLFVGGYAVVQRAGLDPVDEFRKWHSQARVFSTFGNASFLGTYAAFLLPAWVALATGDAGRKWRPAWAAAAAVDALVLYWTYSRGAQLGAAAGLLLVAGYRVYLRPGPGWLRAAFPPALALAVLLVVVVTPREHLVRRTDRAMLWLGTLRMVAAHPLAGWGIGSFPAEYPPFAPPEFAERMRADNTFAEHPHCEYLHVAVETGLPGLGIFAWLLLAVLRCAWCRARRGDAAALAAVGGLLAVLVHIAVDRNFRLASTAAPFWLLAGALFSRGPVPRLAVPLRVPWHAALPLLGGLSLLAGLGLAAFSLRPLLAYHRISREADFLDQAAATSASALESQRAARGHDPAYHMEIGNLYAKERNFPRAAAAFQEALRIEPRMVSAANNLGNSYFMMSRFDEAIAAYRTVLAVNPGDTSARFNMAFAYFHQRKIKEAMRECQAVLDREPGNPKALQLMQQLAP